MIWFFFFSRYIHDTVINCVGCTVNADRTLLGMVTFSLNVAVNYKLELMDFFLQHLQNLIVGSLRAKEIVEGKRRRREKD